MYGYAKLRGRIIEKYGSQKEFAKEMRISENSMSKKMQCKTAFSQEDMIEWSEKLDISVSEIPDYFFT